MLHTAGQEAIGRLLLVILSKDIKLHIVPLPRRERSSAVVTVLYIVLGP